MLTANEKPFFVVKNILTQAELVKKGIIKPGTVFIDSDEYCLVLAILKRVAPNGDLTQLVNESKKLASDIQLSRNQNLRMTDE